MNINLITYFNVALKANDKSFEEVNREAAKYGWLVHPDCCGADTLKWINTVAKTQYNKTFYKKWEDITSKTRFELLVDQLLHYASTYGTDFTAGEGYMPNHENTEIPFQEFKVIMPVTEQEMFDRCVGMLSSGIALKETTQHDIVDYVVKNVKNWEAWNFDLDVVKNKEAQATIAVTTHKYPNDSFGLLRCLVYEATGSTMLIKSKSMIACIKAGASKLDLTRLSDAQMVNLSKIFHRYKPLFLAMKGSSGTSSAMTTEAFKKAMKKAKIDNVVKATNSTVVNKLRKLADTYHTPLVKGFWETVISEQKNMDEVKAKVGEITNFKKVTLMQCIKERLANQKGQCFIIRNGKIWVRPDYQAKSDTTYLMNLYLVLQNSLVDSIKGKACTVRYPKGINLTIPTSEKNFIGNYPVGSYVNMGDDHNVVGIYWENAWFTRDFDLHLQDMEGRTYGWNASYGRTTDKNKVIFSGDITNAPNGATELFYIGGKAEDGIFTVNRFSGDPGKDSQYKFFVAQDNSLANKNDRWVREGGKEYMLDPNKVVAEAMIPVPADSTQSSVAALVDNKFVLLDVKSGNGRVPRHDLNSVIIDKFKVKARSFIELREILEAAGFTEAPVDAEEVGLDLTQISKDTLIDLFA